MKKQMARKLTREEKKEIRSMFPEIPKRRKKWVKKYIIK